MNHVTCVVNVNPSPLCSNIAIKLNEPGAKEKLVGMAISGIRDKSRVLGIYKKVINKLKKEDGLVQVNLGIQKMELETGTIIHVGPVRQEAEIDEQWSYVARFGMQ